MLIRVYFTYVWTTNQAHEKKNCVHRSHRLTQIMEKLFCCWHPSSLFSYAVARKTQQQKESSPCQASLSATPRQGRYLQKNMLFAMPHGDGLSLLASYCRQAKETLSCRSDMSRRDIIRQSSLQQVSAITADDCFSRPIRPGKNHCSYSCRFACPVRRSPFMGVNWGEHSWTISPQP